MAYQNIFCWARYMLCKGKMRFCYSEMCLSADRSEPNWHISYKTVVYLTWSGCRGIVCWVWTGVAHPFEIIRVGIGSILMHSALQFLIPQAECLPRHACVCGAAGKMNLQAIGWVNKLRMPGHETHIRTRRVVSGCLYQLLDIFSWLGMVLTTRIMGIKFYCCYNWYSVHMLSILLFPP